MAEGLQRAPSWTDPLTSEERAALGLKLSNAYTRSCEAARFVRGAERIGALKVIAAELADLYIEVASEGGE